MMDQTYAMEIVDSMRFQEEIQRLMGDGDSSGGGGGGGSSFTALLGLAPHQAAELLGSAPVPSFADAPQGPRVKSEPVESSDAEERVKAAQYPRMTSKRKETEKKVKLGSVKKRKSSEEKGDEKGGDVQKLPYVHVRARRGQATDSHSLAERARREKINARMKLLQELVPGCSKISGTALVLDEIINHVQSLQRQVEFLSMKLAAVNPRIDFSGLDSFLAANPRLTSCNGATTAASSVGLEGPLWAEVPIEGPVGRHHHHSQQPQQQTWQADIVVNPQLCGPLLYERSDNHHHDGFVSNGPSSLLSFDSSTSTSVPLSANQLKMETGF